MSTPLAHPQEIEYNLTITVSTVISVLFLDVEAAFPNALPGKLVEDMSRKGVPKAYCRFIADLLSNRETKLSFDDFTSDTVTLNNGIGQGNPLSMLLYIIYNSALIEIPSSKDEDTLGYVDDVTLLAVGDDFEQTTSKLKNMMEREEGGMEWSRTHNSKFKMSKLVVIHFGRKTEEGEDRIRRPLAKPPLAVNGLRIPTVSHTKYLGVILDNKLSWSLQKERVVEKATKWVLQYRRLTRQSMGVRPKYMAQLYQATVPPRITYALEVWYQPPTKPIGYKRNIGSVGVLKQLTKIQRQAALAITGQLRSTPNEHLEPIKANSTCLPCSTRSTQLEWRKFKPAFNRRPTSCHSCQRLQAQGKTLWIMRKLVLQTTRFSQMDPT